MARVGPRLRAASDGVPKPGITGERHDPSIASADMALPGGRRHSSKYRARRRRLQAATALSLAACCRDNGRAAAACRFTRSLSWQNASRDMGIRQKLVHADIDWTDRRSGTRRRRLLDLGDEMNIVGTVVRQARQAAAASTMRSACATSALTYGPQVKTSKSRQR
jgi:hypothetical protein